MSGDEPSLEPARGLSPLATNLAVGAIAFAGGIGGTALMFQLSGGAWQKPAPPPVTAPAPQPTPAALPPGTDLASLFAREQGLATRLDQLETRLRDVDGGARNAASYATQAERLMIAFAVRRAIERGLPLGPLERQLRRRFAESHGEAVATIAGAANNPVTLEDLRLSLALIAPRMGSAPGDSVWTSFRRVLGDLVVLRQGDAASTRPADRLRRAERLLDEGHVEAALAEVARMPGAASAESWVTAAKRYIAARTALREIEAAAMETPAGA